MSEYTLRNKIEESRRWYMEKYKRLDWQWTDEGLVYALQEYHGGVGSLMNFTDDDWLTCKENGLKLDEVCILCDEEQFCSDVKTEADFLERVPTDLPSDDLEGFVEDFYQWRDELLPNIQKIYES